MYRLLSEFGATPRSRFKDDQQREEDIDEFRDTRT
jgi:hypothetical protein